MSGRRRICLHCKALLARAATGRPRRYCSPACKQAAYRRRRRRSVHFSSKTVEWSTPQWLFDELDATFGPFDLDPCATAENAKCGRYFTRSDDGLARHWAGRVYVNPPYGRALPAWIRKAWESSQNGAEVVVCLVPARTDTRWWHEYVMRGKFRFLPGRVRFGGADSSAPFPSAIVVFRNASSVTKGAT